MQYFVGVETARARVRPESGSSLKALETNTEYDRILCGELGPRTIPRSPAPPRLGQQYGIRRGQAGHAWTRVCAINYTIQPYRYLNGS